MVLAVMGCSSSEAPSQGQPQPGAEAGVDAQTDGGLDAEAGHEAGKDAVSEEEPDSSEVDSPTEAPDSPEDASTDGDAQTPVDAPEEAAAPGPCQPPGPVGNVADCSSLCTTYCEPACPGGGLPGGTGTCNPYLTCDASDPISLSAPVDRAFVLPAETGVHQGLDDTGVTCKPTCGSATSFAFSVGLGHCAKLTSSGGRTFLEDKADCSTASECLVVQGSQSGTLVRVLGSGNGPAWVYAQVDESWSGHPCPYSCP